MKKVLSIFLVLFVACGFCFAEKQIKVKGAEGANGKVHIWADEGDDSADKFSIEATTSGTLIIAQDGTTIFTLSSTGFGQPTPVTENTTSRTVTSADYGKLISVTTNAAVAVTLPANGAAIGSWFDIATGASSDDDCAITVSAATADTLVGPNDVDLDSVTWGTGHRIGAYARFWSDGSFWHVLNLGGTTMTYTD